jgi:hypothetical protein
MKYFTRDLLDRFGSPDPAIADAANTEVENTLSRYERHLAQLRPRLPDHMRRFLDELLLHDAVVLGLARQTDSFLMTLQLDPSPHDLAFLTYQLLEPPVIVRDEASSDSDAEPMTFLYDEFDVEDHSGGPVYTQSILFSNGWEVSLRFRQEHVSLAEALDAVPLTAISRSAG